ncbi:glycosyltransferase [Nonomuraea sp. NN258]|uniref:glycosyltransferase n=1 Tax=Nonomuraea antri TaxID=2730852 RepID=UPI0015682204|nr:glycosyltransferase [Nonomuraea antri]NRQ37979.1 glycosyltransferase [Nonomuraea antri]
MTDAPVLASVVVAVKTDPRLRRLVESLMVQTLPATAYEVLVVENGSSDFADLDGHGDGTVRYLHLDAANAAAARNAGLAAARGRYLLLTDADCVAELDWIEKLTEPLGGGRLAGAGGTIRKYPPRTWTQRHAITIVDGQHALSYLPASPHPYVAGANAGFVTSALREIGGFDEELLSGNDVDVCYKLGLRGYRVGLAPDAVVLHDDRDDIIRHFKRFFRYAVYQVLLYAKYKHISGKRFILDSYPFRRAADALSTLPHSIIGLLVGDPAPTSRAALQLVEAAGVFCGELYGSLRFRQLYL